MICFSFVKRVSALLGCAVGLGLVMTSAGCSSDPSRRPYLEAMREVTGIRVESVEVSPGRALDLLRACLLRAEEVTYPGAGMRGIRTVTFRFGRKWEGQERVLTYDSLLGGNPAYINWSEKWYKIPGEFNAALESCQLYRPNSFAVDAADEAFLKGYGYTPFFLVNSMKVTLPAKLIHKPGEFPVVIYWAYNSELSKDIGLDLSPYLGKSVEARLYKTVEPLPESMGPNRANGRAVILRSEGKVIGAWLDRGGHYCLACSLKGHTLEEATGKDFDAWVTSLIDPQDPVEQGLAVKTPEEIIQTYYSAIDRKDYATAHACESRESLLNYLAMDMDSDRFLNPGFRDEADTGFSNFISVKVLKITREEHFEKLYPPGARCYSVALQQERKAPAWSTGGYFITLRQETPGTGWRIYGIGTGP